MATRRKSKKSESRSTLGTIYDKAKEVVGDMLAGAGTGAVVGAADAAVKSAGGEIEADKKSEANKTSSNSAKKKLEKNGSPKEKKTVSKSSTVKSTTSRSARASATG